MRASIRPCLAHYVLLERAFDLNRGNDLFRDVAINFLYLVVVVDHGGGVQGYCVPFEVLAAREITAWWPLWQGGQCLAVMMHFVSGIQLL